MATDSTDGSTVAATGGVISGVSGHSTDCSDGSPVPWPLSPLMGLLGCLYVECVSCKIKECVETNIIFYIIVNIIIICSYNKYPI